MEILKILFEDEQLIVLNKKAGTNVIPGHFVKREDTLIHFVEQYIKNKVFVVHRLDKETSGVIVFAKDPQTHRLLNLQFEQRQIKKEYLAVALGRLEKDLIIEKPLRQFGSGRMGVDERGKEAVTKIAVLEYLREATLVKLFPLTGRRHQLRVHLYWAGHPLIGDPLYGSNLPVGGISRLMLHAERIFFRHPDGTIREIRAETDKEWESIVERFRRVIT
jgi:tRNA pseudouridine32 synthase/23S rRNA pseudouridine746 synthase